MDALLKVVKDFLANHIKSDAPLLLGFSGGPDSLALLHLLLEAKKNVNFVLHVAHVDHRWRKSSAEEAKRLADEVHELGLPFHLHTLDGHSKNEADARVARLQFFQSLYQKLGCQALLLGHQRDDQSETVLKRILEGASLHALCGMTFVAALNGMQVWRPLLAFEKKDLFQYVISMGLTPILDETNDDVAYLRPRMRKTILPNLAEQFGKEIGFNLSKLGERAWELKGYLERRIERYLNAVQSGPTLDLNPFLPLEKLELEFLLKRFIGEGQVLTHQMLETAHRLIETRASHKVIPLKGNKDLYIDRGVLLLKFK